MVIIMGDFNFTLTVRVPYSWVEKIRERGNLSDYVRDAIKEKLAREEEYFREKIKKEIELYELEIKRRKEILNHYEEIKVRREEEEKAHLITILKAIFEEDRKIQEIQHLNVRDLKEIYKDGEDRKKLRSWIKERLNQISEKTGADYDLLFNLACEYVEGFKEVM